MTTLHPTVTFATFCHPPRYVARLHDPGVLESIVNSHAYPFDAVIVIHQRCEAWNYPGFGIHCTEIDLTEEEIDPLLYMFGINPVNPDAERLTHGPAAAHYWKHHVVNHLRALQATFTDYIVFADCDTMMVSQPAGRSWVTEAIRLLENHPEILIVSPGDGGQNSGFAEGGRLSDGTRLTRNVSQQLFACRAREFKTKVNFDLPWNGQFDGVGGPLQEWYFMLEGRLARYMAQSGQWRAILPDTWRYWHNSYWATDREQEGWRPHG